jgi:hypothetical protein
LSQQGVLPIPQFYCSQTHTTKEPEKKKKKKNHHHHPKTLETPTIVVHHHHKTPTFQGNPSPKKLTQREAINAKIWHLLSSRKSKVIIIVVGLQERLFSEF